jgi:hypothetical protein
MSRTPSARKASSLCHTRAIQTDRQHRLTSAPLAESVETLLQEMVHPAIFSQVAAYRAAGLRERILSLPVMTAFVLGLIWRQLGSGSEAVRVLKRAGLLWSAPVSVSQQAVSDRLPCLPPSLFAGILQEVLPPLARRAAARQRPLPRGLRRVPPQFPHLLALDGSTLDALLHKTGLLRETSGSVLAGRMAAWLDRVTRLPRQVWFAAEPTANALRFWAAAVASLPPHRVLVIDGGFRNYQHFDAVTEQEQALMTPLASNRVVHLEAVLTQRPGLQDALITRGQGKTQCRHRMRLITWTDGAVTYRYLTTVRDPHRLAAVEVMAVYAQRWRIEDTYLLVKRLLPVGLGVFSRRVLPWDAASGVGHLAAVCRAGRRGRCRSGSLTSPAGGHLPGTGLSRVVPFHPSTRTWGSRRSHCVSGHPTRSRDCQAASQRAADRV